ncbi:transmembrane protein 45A-like [Impatiens glandulifera]|uniref:transmembrane protein 45A-like n=1 Tax=Impatiens glandulifera TaxID=253017 RepID=UPI001FB0C2BE|nr:transmembrane protein 45A-like [Impatiens glandulifera]
MGTAIGHVLPGIGYFLVGLWHLVNHIKLHSLNPKSYTALAFFPISNMKYLELYLMMGASGFFILMELLIGQVGHTLIIDGGISGHHLRNFEHAFITLWIFIYAAFALILDRFSRSSSQFYGLTLTLAFVAFGQEYLMFYFHSTDHMGLEGHYHWLLQIATLLSLVTTAFGIGNRRSFLLSFVRSFSILFKGAWYVVMGVVFWNPWLTPKGCFIVKEEYYRVRCHTKEALERAKALTNLEFSWFLVFFVVLTVCLYLYMIRIYPEKVGYQPLMEKSFDTSDDDLDKKEGEDGEGRQKRCKPAPLNSCIEMGIGINA